VALAGLAGGGAAWLADARAAAEAAWAATAGLALVLVVIEIGRALRHGQAGVDVIALLALAGSLLLGEYLAGAVIGLMLATGRALEDYAASRAERELSSLLRRAPRQAYRIEGGEVVAVPVEEVRPGQTLVLREADVIPVDGVVTRGVALLDESALTGESRLVERRMGERVNSGTVNAGSSFEMRATAAVEESTYAGIIRLVRAAQQSKAPFVRLADRYARVFVPVTLVVAGAAWAFSGDAVRALAVLVVATPCPLLLAAPIAIVSGMSRAARRGIVVKGGGALEVLARARALYLDKTGTLTVGAPTLDRITLFDGWRDEGEVLRLAASIDQMSSHVLAAALTRAARERGLALELPDEVAEQAGAGIEGSIAGRAVRVGSLDWVASGNVVPEHVQRFRHRALRDGGTLIFAGVDGAIAGAFSLQDPIRPDAPRAIRALKKLGIGEVVMVTGDHPTVAESVGAALGVDHVLAERAPEEKVEAVRDSQHRRTTLMVGDGINDAPALAAADVGIAMGARGATSSSEAADVVLVVDRLDRLVEALEIAQRSRAIAVQSVFLGMGLSLAAMGVAAFGLLPPVAGAVLQEGIDAAAILNALRALVGRPRLGPRHALPPAMAARLREEHQALTPEVDQLRTLADRLGEVPGGEAKCALDEVRRFLTETVVAHERADEAEIYPAIAKLVGGEDPLAAMHRTHSEIFHLTRAYERLIADLPPEGPEDEDLADLRRVLYALHAVLRLNIAQEEELYLSLDDTYLEPATRVA
jgi:heavy metal translocating P-type ATPase